MNRLRRWWCQHWHSDPANLVMVEAGNRNRAAVYECRRCWQRWSWPV